MKSKVHHPGLSSARSLTVKQAEVVVGVEDLVHRMEAAVQQGLL